MSTSTFSSSAPWSWMSESDNESDYDLTIVLARNEVQRFLKKRELGNVLDQVSCGRSSSRNFQDKCAMSRSWLDSVRACFLEPRRTR